MKTWKPRKGAREVPLSTAKGMYLEKPAGYFTVGSKVNGRMIRKLEESGMKDKITVHEEPPPFHPVMVPSVRGLSHSNDWQERLGGYYLKDSLQTAAEKGLSSDLNSVSYIPPLLRGTGFGDDLKDTGKY